MIKFLYRLLPLKYRAPILSVTWHHPQELFYNHPPTIWASIRNDGGDAMLFTEGSMGPADHPSDLGSLECPIRHGQILEPGFHYGYGPKLTPDIAPDGRLCYRASFVAKNDRGTDRYGVMLCIPVM